jgi:hypothetical protein
VDGIIMPRSMMFNDDFGRVVLNSSSNLFIQQRAYTPGVLTGRWEGQYMVRQTSRLFLHDR